MAFLGKTGEWAGHPEVLGVADQWMRGGDKQAEQMLISVAFFSSLARHRTEEKSDTFLCLSDRCCLL